MTITRRGILSSSESTTPPPQPLTLATPPTQTAVKGSPYTGGYHGGASGGVPPYHYTAVLPSGLIIASSTGAISGTPTVSGTIPSSESVTDSSSHSAGPKPFNFIITASGTPVPDAPPIIDGITVPQTLVFRQEFATDGAVDFSYWNVVNGVTDNAALMLASNVSFSPAGVLLNWTSNTGSLMTTGIQFNSGSPYNITGPGFTISPIGGGTWPGTGPVYVEWGNVTFPTTGSQIANWPALWTGGLYPAGEQDVAEGLGGTLATTIHYNNYTASDRLGALAGVSVGTFGILWTSAGQYVVYNGVVQYSGAIPISDMANQPQCLLIENGGGPGGYGGPSLSGAKVIVPYVRVWQG